MLEVIQNMGFNVYFCLAIMLWLSILFIDFMVLYYKKFNKKINVDLMKNKNETYKLYMQMDPAKIEEEIDKMIQRYIDRYVVTNILANQIQYINKEETTLMIKTLDKTISLELSEMYLFYIKCLVNIRTDDDLLKYIHTKVKEHVLTFITNYNKTK